MFIDLYIKKLVLNSSRELKKLEKVDFILKVNSFIIQPPFYLLFLKKVSNDLFITSVDGLLLVHNSKAIAPW